MVIAARGKNELQRAFDKFQQWAKLNDYKICKKKTMTMLFKKVGRTAVQDYIHCKQENLEMVSSFKYIGFTVKITGFTYRSTHRFD
jgi:threonine dehydratase